MQLEFWPATDVGKQRKLNEDNYLIDKKLQLFIVADGMGGHAAGEVASAMCVNLIREAVREKRDVIERFSQGTEGVKRGEVVTILEQAMKSTCAAIYRHAEQEKDKRGMGTTCSTLLIAGDRGFIVHVGDSRIYLVRQGEVHQLTEDHSLVNELLRQGKIKSEDINSGPYRHVKNALTRAVGVYESVEVFKFDFEILPGDQFLLCSDGLHSYLDEQKIKDVYSRPDIKVLTKDLIDLANEGGGHDNITAVSVRIPQSEGGDVRVKELSLKVEVLRKMPIFRYLNYQELVSLMNITAVKKYADGELIIRENTVGEELLILLEGKVRLSKKDAFITALERGDHFGEMALIDAGPRSASAMSEGPSRLLVIKRSDFYDIIRTENKLAVKLLWSFVQVLANRLRKTTAHLSEARLEGSIISPYHTTEEIIFAEDATVPKSTDTEVTKLKSNEVTKYKSSELAKIRTGEAAQELEEKTEVTQTEVTEAETITSSKPPVENPDPKPSNK